MFPFKSKPKRHTFTSEERSAGGRKRWSKIQRLKIVKLTILGMSAKDIGKEMECSAQSIISTRNKSHWFEDMYKFYTSFAIDKIDDDIDRSKKEILEL